MTRVRPRPTQQEIARFGAMIESLRLFLNRVTGAVPAPGTTDRIRETLDGFSRELEPDVVSEEEQIAGLQPEIPGRAQALVPPLRYEQVGDDGLRSTVTFGRLYQGRGPAVHGGAIPLLFDEFFGVLAERGNRPRARTAFLKVDYRAITPPDVELCIEGRVDRIEGRKRYVVGTLHAGDTLCAEAQALYVELRPGQP